MARKTRCFPQTLIITWVQSWDPWGGPTHKNKSNFKNLLFSVHECLVACVYVYPVCAWCSWWPGEGIWSMGKPKLCRYKLPCGCSESNSCLLKGQQVLLTAEPFKSIFKEKLVVCRVIFHVWTWIFDVKTEFIIEDVAIFQQIKLITAGSLFFK